MEVLRKIEALPLPPTVPTIELPPMHMTHERARMDRSGVTHIHHFFLPRAAQAMGKLWHKAKNHNDPRIRSFLLFMVEQAIWTMSVLNRNRPSGYSQVNQYLSGVFYIASQTAECSPWYVLDGKLSRLVKAFSVLQIQAHGGNRHWIRHEPATARRKHRLYLHRSAFRGEHLLRRPEFPCGILARRDHQCTA